MSKLQYDSGPTSNELLETLIAKHTPAALNCNGANAGTAGTQASVCSRKQERRPTPLMRTRAQQLYNPWSLLLRHDAMPASRVKIVRADG